MMMSLRDKWKDKTQRAKKTARAKAHRQKDSWPVFQFGELRTKM